MSQISNYFNAGVIPPGTFVETLTGNSGGAVGPDGANNINILGSGVISVAGNPGTNTLTISGSGAIGSSFPTDAGTATPALGILNVLGGTAGRDINTSGAGNTIHIDLNNAITLGDLAVIGAGLDALSATTGDINIAAGNLKLPNTNGAGTQGEILFGGARFISNFGATNTFVGSGSGNTTTAGFSNVAMGTSVLSSLTIGAFNTAVGFNSQLAMTEGSNNASIGEGSLAASTGAGTSNNTALGSLALSTATGPINNIAVGFNAASNYTTTESDNIIIGNTGTIADSARIRIGQNGTQTSAFIVGIDGVNVGSTAKVVTMGTAGTADQLGTATITAGTNITITPGANTITIAAAADLDLTYTAVNTTPYVVLSTDQYLGVDCSGAPIQINLPNAPSTGRVIVIKDSTGSANTNNITVTTVGGVVNIDGATTYVMNTQYAAIEVIFNGTAYEIF